jgi:hypothetical protein
MKNKISILALGILSSNLAFAEPVWYGNLNMNLNTQENFKKEENISDVYMDSNYSYLGIAGKEKAKDARGIVKSLKYKVEYELDINNDEESLILHQALGAIEMVGGTLLIGHQNPIQRDLLLKPMDVFNASRIIALEEAYVDDVIKNTVRLDTNFLGMYFGASASMNNPDPESDDIDSFAVGLASKGQSYQYGVVYWEDNDYLEARQVGYWGANATYSKGMLALSVSLVQPVLKSMSDSSDVAIVMKMSNDISAKTKYGKLNDNWESYGFGIEGNLTDASKWYIEYQEKKYFPKIIEGEKLTSIGINYKI